LGTAFTNRGFLPGNRFQRPQTAVLAAAMGPSYTMSTTPSERTGNSDAGSHIPGLVFR